MDNTAPRRCLECRRPLAGRSDKLRHDRCAGNALKRRYRERLYAAGLKATQSFARSGTTASSSQEETNP